MEEQRVVCTKCGGAGVVTHHRSRWIGGGKVGYRSTYELKTTCTCIADQTVEVEAAAQHDEQEGAA